MINTVEMADDYFSTNFMNKDAWEALDTATKELLIETAENDINAVLCTQNIDSSVISTTKPYTPYQMAVFEWAVYMTTNKARLTQLTNNRVFGATSVRVDGIGEEEYASAMAGSGTSSNVITSLILNSPAGKYLGMIYRDVRIIR